MKLLRSAESKYLEVEGIVLTANQQPIVDIKLVDDESCASIMFQQVDACVQLELPIVIHNCCELGSGLLTQISDSCEDKVGELNSFGSVDLNNFVRIPVTFDSDSEEENEKEDEYGDSPSLTEGFHRIVVEEEEEDEEEGKDSLLLSTEVAKSDVLETPVNEKAHDCDRFFLVQRALELKESGNVLLKAGRIQEALEAYNASLDCDPLCLPSLGNRSQAYLVLQVIRFV